MPCVPLPAVPPPPPPRPARAGPPRLRHGKKKFLFCSVFFFFLLFCLTFLAVFVLKAGPLAALAGFPFSRNPEARTAGPSSENMREAARPLAALTGGLSRGVGRGRKGWGERAGPPPRELHNLVALPSGVALPSSLALPSGVAPPSSLALPSGVALPSSLAAPKARRPRASRAGAATAGGALFGARGRGGARGGGGPPGRLCGRSLGCVRFGGARRGPAPWSTCALSVQAVRCQRRSTPLGMGCITLIFLQPRHWLMQPGSQPVAKGHLKVAFRHLFFFFFFFFFLGRMFFLEGCLSGRWVSPGGCPSLRGSPPPGWRGGRPAGRLRRARAEASRPRFLPKDIPSPSGRGPSGVTSGRAAAIREKIPKLPAEGRPPSRSF